MRPISIKSVVYGGLDGIITTFAVVSGVTGASLAPIIIVILGIANLVADGISMAAGDFLSTRAKRDYNRRQVKEYEEHFDLHAGLDEMLDEYKSEGISEDDVKALRNVFRKHPDIIRSVAIAQHTEKDKESAVQNAIVTFIAFAMFGFVPLFAYLMAFSVPFFAEHTFVIACVLTTLTLITLGILRGQITKQSSVKTAIETLFVGGLAATAAYMIGYGLSLLV